MSPWFQQVERRLSIAPWLVPANPNNELLRHGAAKLGISSGTILRNVKGCWNLGSCGLGCPTNAKQGMLTTTIPAALDRGATLLVQTRAERVEIQGDKVSGIVCRPVEINSAVKAGAGTSVRARHYVIAGGAINTPGLLLRSKAPDPHGLLGRRTFLHPVVVSTAVFDQPIEAWSGAPQTIYTDHFLGVAAIDGAIGYKLEAPPLYPVISSIALTGFGAEQVAAMAEFARTQGLLALLRDGFHADSPGGAVTLGGDGTPVLDYQLTDFVMEGARRALLSMAEIQFAGGARSVTPGHELARPYTSCSR